MIAVYGISNTMSIIIEKISYYDEIIYYRYNTNSKIHHAKIYTNKKGEMYFRAEKITVYLNECMRV